MFTQAGKPNRNHQCVLLGKSVVCQCLRHCAVLITTFKCSGGPGKVQRKVSHWFLFAIEKRWFITEIADVLYCHEWWRKGVGSDPSQLLCLLNWFKAGKEEALCQAAVTTWNSLPQGVMDSRSLNRLKNRWRTDKFLLKVMAWMQPLDQEIFNNCTGCKKEKDCLYSMSLLFFPLCHPWLFFFLFGPVLATAEEQRELDLCSYNMAIFIVQN